MNFADTSSSELFGSNVFGMAEMERRLPKQVYRSLKRTIEQGKELDVSLADVVANAMKAWAIDKGATHYAHVFFPLTGLTAEKHDSFLAPDGKGGAILEFTGAALICGEPDASSFPSGGLRATFEARGYTAWDVTSPAVHSRKPERHHALHSDGVRVVDRRSAGQEDPRAPLHAGSEQAGSARSSPVRAHRRICGGGDRRPRAGILLDRPQLLFCATRPADGRSHAVRRQTTQGTRTRRSLFRCDPRPRAGVHVGSRPRVVQAGHPGQDAAQRSRAAQYEIAPVFETANLATDHQQLVMVTLKRVAEKYGMACLLHEKPFAGINGSGKHVNYSLGSASQGNLLDPGDTPHANMQFLVFCAAFIRAVHKYGALLRAVVAHAGNDHRLGANEAPPAIISVFLGEQLTQIFDQIRQGGEPTSEAKCKLTVGVNVLPPLPKDAGDRNRTSPFAFTGNRFEFRAVGSSQSIAGPLVAMNTIVAESLDFIATQLEKATGGDAAKLPGAVQIVLRDIIEKHGAVVFNGDGYSEDWHREAEIRGLPNLKTTVDALPVMGQPEVVDLFVKYGVLSKRELESRMDIYLEQYVKTLNVESKLVVEMGKTMLFPAAIRYQSELAVTCANLKAVGYTFDTDTLDKVTALVKHLQDNIAALEKAMQHHGGGSLLDEATHYLHEIVPAMLAVRKVADDLEGLVADDLWPLPTYQEMLFIK